MISFFEQIADKLHRFSQRGCESFWWIRLDANGSVSPKMALLALKKRFFKNFLFSPEFLLFLRVRWMRMIRGRRQHNCIFQEKAGNAQKHKKSREIGDFTAFLVVDLEGFEPLTSRMRTERSPERDITHPPSVWKGMDAYRSKPARDAYCPIFSIGRCALLLRF